MFKDRLDRVLHVKESEQKFREQLKEQPLEKKDIPAMILAALLTLLPALLIVIGLAVLVAWLLFH